MDFVDMELSGAKNPEFNGRFYLRLVKLNKDSEGPGREGEDTEEDWMFWKAKVVDTQVRSSIKFIAESFRVLESPAPKYDFVDVEVAVLSTNVTGNGRQYVLEDLQKNAASLNSDGGLIFAMGRHPNQDEEPDATDNVGVGQTYMENDLLKSKARIYNTSTFPDMTKRIRLGLVRDVSIEGMVGSFKKTCNGDGCWMKGFGLTINRAVFVHAGADPLAKIERILESIETEVKNLTEHTQTKTEQTAAPAAPAAESAPADAGTQAAQATVKEEDKVKTVEAAAQTAPAPVTTVTEATPAAPQPAAEAAPPAPETAPKPDAFEKVLGEYGDLKKMMSDMLGMMGEMKNMMNGKQAQSAAAQEAARAVIAESQGSEIERPPRVKESQATPNASQSSFFNEVKKLVR
jgi:hypothetical protein